MKRQLFLAVGSPAFGRSFDEGSKAFPDNQVYELRLCTLQTAK
jgi:hypothetical protein